VYLGKHLAENAVTSYSYTCGTLPEAKVVFEGLVSLADEGIGSDERKIFIL
jgi:hypothetical protein